MLHTSSESIRYSQNCVYNPSSYTTSNMLLPSSNPSDALHPTNYDRKRDTQEEYTRLIKTALWNTIQNVNFWHPAQTRKAHEALMCETNREAKYSSTQWIDPLYFGWDKSILTLENHFPDILDERLNCDNQRSASANREATIIFRDSHTNTEQHKGNPALDSCNLKIELSPTLQQLLPYYTIGISQLSSQCSDHKPYSSQSLHFQVYTQHFCMWIQQSLPPSWQKNTTVRAPN